MNAATDPTLVVVPASVLTAPAPPAPLNAPLDALPPEPEPLLVPVTMRELRPTPPPPPRTATVPAVRVGVAVAALGGLILLAGIFAPPWYGLREITVRPPPQTATQGQGGGGTGGNGGSTGSSTPQTFSLRQLTQEAREQGAVTWASTRFEKRTVAVVGVALAAEAFALMSLVSMTWWRPLVSLAGIFAAALPAVAFADLLNLTNVMQRRYVGMILARGLNNGQPVQAPDLVIAGIQPGMGMNVLFVGAGVAVFGALIALMGGRRSRVLAHMPKHP